MISLLGDDDDPGLFVPKVLPYLGIYLIQVHIIINNPPPSPRPL